MAILLHITNQAHWQQAQLAGFYSGDTLTSEGFIHCSTPSQVVAVANACYWGQSSLVLLCIDPRQVQAEIKYEGAASGEQFPHIYGPLSLTAVVEVLPFTPQADGSFGLPDAIALM